MKNVRHVYPIVDSIQHNTEGDVSICVPRIDDLPEGRLVIHNMLSEQPIEVWNDAEAAHEWECE